MAPLYNKALVIGATSGIGEALAARFVQNGTKVVVSGRRQAKLDAFVREHGETMAAAMPVDLLDLASLPGYARTVTERHPDIDAVVINSGVQRAFDFCRPETVDLGTVGEEMTTNYVAYVHLIKAFLPHLFAKDAAIDEAAKSPGRVDLVCVGSSLGFMPVLVRAPNYCASKSALHAFLLDLRAQLRDGGRLRRLRVVEVFPPAVQTELHDAKHQPDLVDGHRMGMPLAECVDAFVAGLEAGDEQIGIGYAADYFKKPDGAETRRREQFEEGHRAISGLIKNHLRTT